MSAKISAHNLIKFYISLSIIVLLLDACNTDDDAGKAKEENLEINLKWFPGSFNQSEAEMRTGLTWALSYLGAALPPGSMDASITELADRTFTIDLSKVGFEDFAEVALQKVVTTLKESPAYQETGATELGRFIMLTVNSSYHYFEITGIPKTLDEFKSSYLLEGKKVRVVNSSISNVNRLIEISEANKADEIAYLAMEGEGDFEDGTFAVDEFETVEFMNNGQFRFGLYGINGELKVAADERLTRAGKPAKCLWCHESSIQPLFLEMPVLPGEGFISKDDFLNIRNQFLLFVADHRLNIDSEIDYTDLQAHALMEHIYLDFMEPSAERLSEEWNIPLATVNGLLSGLATHRQEEFGHESLFDRKDVEQFAPHIVTEVPESAREFSVNEPNFFF